MTLAEAKQLLLENDTQENRDHFLEAFAALVNTSQQVYVPVQREVGRIRPMFAQHKGEIYAAMYSSYDAANDASLKPDGSKGTAYGALAAPALMDLLYSSPRFAGILVDPGEQELPLPRRLLHERTVCKDPRLEKRDWGIGLPDYSKADLAVIEELMDLAMEAVASAAADNGFEPVDSCSSPVYMPNYILRKDGELYFVLVEVAIAPSVPSLREEKKRALLECAAKHGAHSLYAPVAIGSRDQARFEAGLVLAGDDFLLNLMGLIPVG